MAKNDRARTRLIKIQGVMEAGVKPWFGADGMVFSPRRSSWAMVRTGNFPDSIGFVVHRNFPLLLVRQTSRHGPPHSRGKAGVLESVGRTVLAFGLFLLATVHGLGAPPTSENSPTAFYVDSHGWHSGIIVPRAAIPPGAWPPGVVARDFAGCEYLEIGWGDRKFYPAKHPGVLLALDAALLPGPSVLHLAGFHPPLADAHPWSALVAVPCTREDLGALCRDLGRRFETDAAGNVPRLGPGLYGARSGFYPARGRYWIVHTCNHWTACEMRAGGVSVKTGFLQAFTSGQVVKQARRSAAAAR